LKKSVGMVSELEIVRIMRGLSNGSCYKKKMLDGTRKMV